MALTQFTKDMNIIAALSDDPNVTDGLTAAQLKAKFDEGGLAVKTYLNGTLKTFVDGLSDGKQKKVAVFVGTAQDNDWFEIMYGGSTVMFYTNILIAGSAVTAHPEYNELVLGQDIIVLPFFDGTTAERNGNAANSAGVQFHAGTLSYDSDTDYYTIPVTAVGWEHLGAKTVRLQLICINGATTKTVSFFRPGVTPVPN